MASIDFLTVPTATFRVLYAFLVLSHDRRSVVYWNVTSYPGAQRPPSKSLRGEVIGEEAGLPLAVVLDHVG